MCYDIRQDAANKKAEQLNQLCTFLQQRRAAGEKEEVVGPINEQHREDMDNRKRELAELGRWGTADRASVLAPLFMEGQ